MDDQEGSSSAVVMEQSSSLGLSIGQSPGTTDNELMMRELSENFLAGMPQIQVHHIETGGQCAHEVSFAQFGS